MLDQSTRAAILKLRQQGHSLRGIARALKLSRGAVRSVLRSATEIVPTLVRPEKATPYRDQILELYVRCQGNLVRVHEKLTDEGAKLSYPALTAYCRRHGLGKEPVLPVGQYDFLPGEEIVTSKLWPIPTEYWGTTTIHLAPAGMVKASLTSGFATCAMPDMP